MNHLAILSLLQDVQPRTSYEICDTLYGPQPDGVKWWRVAGACDWMVEKGQLISCGKVERKTVYKIAPNIRESNLT